MQAHERIELGAIWCAVAVLFFLQITLLYDAYQVPKDGPSRIEVIRSNTAVENRLIELEIKAEQ